MFDSEKLFSSGDLSKYFDSHLRNFYSEISKTKKIKFELNDDKKLIDYFYSNYEICPLKIFPDAKTRGEPEEGFVDNKEGIEIKVEIPYMGDTCIWRYRPNNYLLVQPYGEIKEEREEKNKGLIEVTHLFYLQYFEFDKVNNEIQENIDVMEKYISFVNDDVNKFNKRLENEIKRAVKARREKLKVIQETTQKLEIPLKPNPGSPSYEEIPLRKKKISPLSSKQGEKIEYAISQEGYETILQLIHHVGISFERTPSTFNIHDEEELRDIILAFLNGYFEGRATGETFRKRGKTDICIEEKNRSAFIGECKIWRGPKKAYETVNQLLGYTTWRDVKTAIIFFNTKNKGFSTIQNVIPNVLRKHPKWVKKLDSNEFGEWRYEFHSDNDDMRSMIVHVFLFDLFVDHLHTK